MFHQNDVPEEVFFIRIGFIKASNIDENGNQRIVWIAGRYDTVPSESFFSIRTESKYDYIALSTGSAYRIPKKHFLDTTKVDPATVGQLASEFSNHYDTLLDHVAAINQNSVRNKLIHVLHSLALRFCVGDSCDFHEIGLVLTHQDIADMIGITRESISIEMKLLMDEHVISYDRASFIVHTKKLATLL